MTDLLKNDPIKKNIAWNDITIGVEWPKGSTRQYANSDFKKHMIASYGYIKNTDSVDGEEIDVYIGEDSDAEYVYKVKQLFDPAEGSDKEAWTFDEWKFMLNFESQEEAEKTYIKCMTKQHFGGCTKMTIASFKKFIAKNKKTKSLTKSIPGLPIKARLDYLLPKNKL